MPGAVELKNASGRVDIENVSFGYTPSRQILHDISVHAEPGKTIAIVGPTGAGKTTIINLLMRFYDPVEGKIRVDGSENREITRSSLRRAYTMMLQDTWLFHGTIYENIIYGKENATPSEVYEAAKAARISSYIERLPGSTTQQYVTYQSYTSVTVPTVDRGFRFVDFWSMEIAGGSRSQTFHIRFFHLSQKLPGIRGQRFHITPLSLLHKWYQRQEKTCLIHLIRLIRQTHLLEYLYQYFFRLCSFAPRMRIILDLFCSFIFSFLFIVFYFL